jgi:peptidase M28-like protein
VVDLRLYRITFLPALLAVVALLFSLQSQPAALAPLVSPATFEQAAAAHITRQIVGRAPERPPGSDLDNATADLVERAFRRVRGGEVLDQRFSGTFNGDDVQMRNVILRLPGSSDHIVALIAPRDSASGPGATTSAAATASLIQLASDLGSSRHAKTILLVSTDGSSAGEAGAKELASGILEGNQVDGVVALEAPGAASPQPPYLIDTSDGPNRGSIQLERTAERALKDQAGVSVSRPGTLEQLIRLAVPSGVGEQAPLIDRGIPAVALSSTGELPPDPSADTLDSLSSSSLGGFTRAAYDVVLSLDAGSGIESGPSSYIEVGGNLVPGWAILVLALSLILPALVAVIDGLARAARQGVAREGLLWAAPRAAPFVAALAFLYLLALLGIVARPPFPFDPETIGIGFWEVVLMLLIASVAGAAWWALGRNGMPRELDREAAATGIGLILVIADLILLGANPYLALLAVPVAHAWIPQATSPRPRPAAAPRAVAVIALMLLPTALAISGVASRLHLGGSLPWQTLVMVGDGGVSIPVALAACVIIGCLAGLLVLVALPRETAAGAGWTDSRLREDAALSINATEGRKRPAGGDQEERSAPGREAEKVEEADSRGRLQSRLDRSGRRDPEEAQPHQEGPGRDRS